jgi:hypothetical protein
MQLDTREDACCANDNTRQSCSVPIEGQSGCTCASQAKSSVLQERPFSIEETRLLMNSHPTAVTIKQSGTDSKNSRELRRNIRGTLMLGVACITSPCCTPLIVPVMLGLLAGTPMAVWLTQNVGWVYGGLTLVSVISLVLGLRWAWQKLALPTPLDSLPRTAVAPRLPSSPITLYESAVQPVISQPVQIGTEKQ